MNRMTRSVLCAFALSVLGFAAAPAFAQGPPPPPGPGLITPASIVKLIQTVTAVGGGETEAEAEANAVASLTSTYRILRYTVTNSFCTEIELLPHDPNPETITLCAVEIEARVIRKIIFHP